MTEIENCMSILEALEIHALQEINRAESTGIFTFSGDFPGFHGHFPGDPVLPAVAHTAAVQLLAQKLFNSKLTPLSAANIKFNKTVTPDEAVNVHLRNKQKGSRVKVFFTLSGKSGRIASGEIVYERIM